MPSIKCGLIVALIILAPYTPLSATMFEGTGKGILRGFVTDSTSGEPLIYANVIIKGTSLGSATNNYGFFVIPGVPSGSYVLIVSMLGYYSKQLQVQIGENEITTVRISLTPTTIVVSEIEVFGQRAEERNPTDLGIEKISMQQMKIVPTAVESDVFRILQVLPGVSMTGDVSAKYYVRGGAGDQNLVLLNGATVYYPFHALGVFGVIDPEMMSGMEFFKGGFPPEYGGRLSSILDITTRDGNKNDYSAGATLSLATAKAYAEGPLRNGSLLLTARKSYYGKSLDRFFSNQTIPFDFWDWSFKINSTERSLDPDSKFAVHGFFSGDDVIHHDPQKEDYSLGNSIVGFNWYKVWEEPLYTAATISYSGFRAEVRPNFSTSRRRSNRIHDITNRMNGAYIYDSKDELRFGVTNIWLSYDLDVENLYGERYVLSEHKYSLSSFLTYRFNRWENIGINMGLRFNFSTLSEGLPLLFEPRLSITYRPYPIISLKAGIGWYTQELVTLSNENELISIFEPWVIIPSYLYTPQAVQVMSGVELLITESFRVECEGYYKPVRYLLDVNPIKYSPKERDYKNIDGESYGIEMLTTFESRTYYVRLAYSLSWAYKHIGEHVEIPKYDARHALNALVNIRFGKGWECSTLWTFKTGLPFTPIVAFYDRIDYDPWNKYSVISEPIPAILWGGRNASRLPAYHRLDYTVTKRLRWAPTELEFGASIVNVYNRHNIFYFDRDTGSETYMLPLSVSVFLGVSI